MVSLINGYENISRDAFLLILIGTVKAPVPVFCRVPVPYVVVIEALLLSIVHIVFNQLMVSLINGYENISRDAFLLILIGTVKAPVPVFCRVPVPYVVVIEALLLSISLIPQRLQCK